MACNTNGGTPVAGICDVKGNPPPLPKTKPQTNPPPPAGGRFTVEMHSQANDRSCTSQAIGGNHFGPVIVYMAKVADATTASPSGLSWFKVDEEGYDASTKVWGTDSLNKNCGKREFTVPSKIPAGDYLVRAEAIALHAAGQVGGAQFYMTCYVSFVLVGRGVFWVVANGDNSKSRLRVGVVGSFLRGFRSRGRIKRRILGSRLISTRG